MLPNPTINPTQTALYAALLSNKAKSTTPMNPAVAIVPPISNNPTQSSIIQSSAGSSKPPRNVNDTPQSSMTGLLFISYQISAVRHNCVTLCDQNILWNLFFFIFSYFVVFVFVQREEF
eukprot:405787_1